MRYKKQYNLSIVSSNVDLVGVEILYNFILQNILNLIEIFILKLIYSVYAE